MIPQVKPWLGKEELKAVVEPVKNNWLTEGPKCKEFSEKLNELMGVEYGVFAPNGTLALYLGLLALGIGVGDKVIVPNSTFIASANAVILTGATPEFVDVDEGFHIDYDKCLVKGDTKAIMPVHLYGTMIDMDETMRFAEDMSLLVIEDACQAIGVKFKGQHAGTFGDIGCFSFFADKTITTGEGGYVVCKTEAMYKKLLMLRNQGRENSGTFIHPSFGVNFRITDLQAAIGLVQLKKLDIIIQQKLKILEWYHKGLDDIKEIRFFEPNEDANFVPFRVVLMCENAHLLMEHLSVSGVQSRGFFYPLHKQPCFEEYDYRDRYFPNSIYGYEHGVCLPVFPELTLKDVNFICEIIKGFYDKTL